MALPARASSGRVISNVVLGLIALSVVREVSAFVPVLSTFPGPLQSASMKEGRVGSVQLEKVATVLAGRTLDTIGDLAMHIGRLQAGAAGEALGTKELEFADWEVCDLDDVEGDCDPRPRIVVLGSGWAAHAFVKVVDASRFRVVVVSPRNHFLFTPMLASAAVGTVEYRSMTEAIRTSNPLIEYVEGAATAIDPEGQSVDVTLNPLSADEMRGETFPGSISIKYDHLVVACGCRVSDSVVPGAREHCLRLKDCDDAQQIRVRVGKAFEQASRPGLDDAEKRRLLTFVVVGGGPTGVEIAGEFSDFVRDMAALYPKLKGFASLVLLHGGNALLPMFDMPLREDAARRLRDLEVDVRLNTRVGEVGPRSLLVKVKGTGEEAPLDYGLCVWCAGTEPQPFTANLLDKLPGSARAEDGRVVVDQWLRVEGAGKVGSVMVLGDAAYVLDRAEPLPQTAQVAGQQGAYVARLINRDYDLARTPPRRTAQVDFSEASAIWRFLDARGLSEAPGFNFLNLGLLAYVGGGQALSQVQLGDWKLFEQTGSVAFLLWRSVYLVKQVATRNRLLVTFDWVKSYLFGRDVTRF